MRVYLNLIVLVIFVFRYYFTSSLVLGVLMRLQISLCMSLLWKERNLASHRLVQKRAPE